jgi:hypothetical protein
MADPAERLRKFIVGALQHELPDNDGHVQFPAT